MTPSARLGSDTAAVLLVSMPWHALERPSLGLSLLKAAMDRDGHPCEILYLGFNFADSVGLDDYLWVQSALPYTAFAGDWLFTSALHGADPTADGQYVRDVLINSWAIGSDAVARLMRIRARIEPFLAHCLSSVRWSDYDVVGFTSTFEQNIASLALAKRVKALAPNTTIAFGGANWEGEMGLALHRAFPFVDVVFTGEADISFPQFVRARVAGADIRDIPGLVVREPDGTSRSTGDPAVVRDLDRLPVPGYGDFIRQLESSPSAVEVCPTLLLETSRGCWWGAKHHCTFCGLNGGTMAFRSKSADRVLSEIDDLLDANVRSVAVVDNILDMHYFRTVIPELARRGGPLRLFYEVKANLTRTQVAALASAGIRRVQPGIESLSDNVLSLMRKGTTGLQNIQLLKWCKEYSVIPDWNMLYGFPGEDPADYSNMIGLLEAIKHLDPPSGQGPVRLDRFSPYHSDPGSFGMVSIRPARPYRYLYRLPEDDLMHIAYYFDYEYADGRDLDYAQPFLEQVRAWRTGGSRGALTVSPKPDGTALILDSREATPNGYTLEPWQTDLYSVMDSVTTHAALLRRGAHMEIPPTEIDDFLAVCHQLKLAAQVGDRWLGLAVHQPTRLEPERLEARPNLMMSSPG